MWRDWRRKTTWRTTTCKTTDEGWPCTDEGRLGNEIDKGCPDETDERRHCVQKGWQHVTNEEPLCMERLMKDNCKAADCVKRLMKEDCRLVTVKILRKDGEWLEEFSTRVKSALHLQNPGKGSFNTTAETSTMYQKTICLKSSSLHTERTTVQRQLYLALLVVFSETPMTDWSQC